MGKEEEIKTVARMLLHWRDLIDILKPLGFVDGTRTAEDLAVSLLNEIYGLNLINLNKEEPNTAGIDLGDKKTGVAFQVTTISPKHAVDKIEKNLAAFQKLYRQDYPQGIRFLLLNPVMPGFTPAKKRKFAGICPGFDTDRHVLGVKDLLAAIDTIYDKDEEGFRRIKKILQRETGFADSIGKDDEGRTGLLNILREGSLAYYRALRGPTGRFRFLSISEIILPGSRHTWLDTGAAVESPDEDETITNQKFCGGPGPHMRGGAFSRFAADSQTCLSVNKSFSGGQGPRRGHPLNQPQKNLTAAFDLSSMKAASTIPHAVGFFKKAPLVIDALPGLWQKEVKHAVIVGPGGMGKTVSLLKWWEKLLAPAPGNGEKAAVSPIPVFIALNELNQLGEGERKDFILSYIVKHYAVGDSGVSGTAPITEQVKALMKRPLAQGESFVPAVVLLLDGFNEITVEKKELLVELKNLTEQCPGLQVVLTSRYDMRSNFNWGHWHRVELLELEEESIEKYLSEIGAAVPRQDNKQSRLRTLIANPMMLTLYAAACEVQENYKDSPLCCFKERVETPGELLWNFLEAQVARLPERHAQDEKQVAYYTFLLKYFLPGIGFAMEKAGLFDFTEQQLVEQMDKLCLRFARDDFFDTFFEFAGEEDHLPVYEEEKIKAKDKRKTAKQLIKNLCGELSMLVQEGQSYRFLHQDFRDFFAAVYLLNECEIASKKEEIPGLLKERPLDFFVRRFMGEIEGEHYAVPYLMDKKGWQIDVDNENRLHRVVDVCRGKFRAVVKSKIWSILSVLKKGKSRLVTDVGFTVWNIVEIWKEVRGELSGADLSHLDLSGITLNGVRCSRFYLENRRYLAASLAGARVNERSLFPFGHRSLINSTVYSPDGKKILSASNDKTIKEWDVRSGQCIQTLAGHSESVISAVYNLDGTKILSASGDNTIKEWTATIGLCIRTLTGHSDTVEKAVYSPDGKKILSASRDNTIKEWDADTGECLQTLTGHSLGVTSAVYSPDGQKILSTSFDSTIKEWDAATGECIHTLTGHSGSLYSAIYSPDGQKILSASVDSTIKEWDAATGECIHTLTGHSGSVYSAIYSRDGKKILSASTDETIKEWDADTGLCIRTLTGDSEVVNSAVYSPDGGKILSASFNNKIKEWNVTTGLCIRTLTGHSDTVEKAVYRSKGPKILSASWDKTIKEWDMGTVECIRTLLGHSDTVNSAIYSRDGKKILSASTDETIKEWDAATGQCIRTITGHSGWVDSPVYSPDGKKIFATSGNHTIKEWDAATGQCIGTWEENEKAADAKRAEYAWDRDNIELKTDGNTIYFRGRKVVNIPGLWIQGCFMQNLEKGSTISAENRKLLKQYGAILD